MHHTSLENMDRCIRAYLPQGHIEAVDLGSYDVNGSYRGLFPARVQYTGYDLEPGPGVDHVLADPYVLPMADASVDLVVSGQMLEHCPPSLLFVEPQFMAQTDIFKATLAPLTAVAFGRAMQVLVFILFTIALSILAKISFLALIDNSFAV